MQRRARATTLARLAGMRTVMIGTHFAAPCAGHVVRDGDAFRLET